MIDLISTDDEQYTDDERDMDGVPSTSMEGMGTVYMLSDSEDDEVEEAPRPTKVLKRKIE